MRIESVASLNIYLRDFYAAAVTAAHAGEPYKAPQRTADAAATTDEPQRSGVFVGHYRHRGSKISRIEEATRG